MARISQSSARELGPYIVLGVLQIPGQHVYGFPPARPHDSCGVEPALHQILCRAHAHGVTAEGLDVVGIEAGPFGGLFDQPLHSRRAEVPIDRLALILPYSSKSIRGGCVRLKVP